MDVSIYGAEHATMAPSAPVASVHPTRNESVAAVATPVHDKSTSNSNSNQVGQESGKSDLNLSKRAVHTEVDRELARPITTIVNSETKEIIMEFPSEDQRKASAQLRETMGLIFDREG